MHRSIFLPLLAVSIGAFGCKSDPTPAPLPSATATAAALPSGTRVVAAVTKVSFEEGAVVSSDDQQVTIAVGEAPDAGRVGPTRTVRRDAVWSLDDSRITAAQAAKQGGLGGICELELTGRQGAEPAWHPCEVTGGASGKLRVRDAYGQRHTLAPDQVIVPDPTTSETITTYLERERRHRTFDEAVESSGRPFAPESWDPAAGDAVVVHFVGPSWYGAEVVEHKRNEGKVRIRYDGGTWDDRDVSLKEIAPVPKGTLPVSADGFALLRPDKPTKRWEPVRVESLAGDRAVVVDRDEEERTVDRHDLLPMIPKPD